MPGHVISPMSRKGVFRDVMPSRNVAIRDAGPQIGFDIMTLGVPADSAGVRHAVTVLPSPSHRAELPSPDLLPFSLYLRAVLSPLLQLGCQVSSGSAPCADVICHHRGYPCRHWTTTRAPALDCAVGHATAEQFDGAAANARIIANRPRQKPSHRTFAESVASRQRRGRKRSSTRLRVVALSARTTFGVGGGFVYHIEDYRVLRRSMPLFFAFIVKSCG